MSDYCKVLIIDDEFIMRQGMKHMLEWEKEGFVIVGEASNGQEGLARVEEVNPHIVIADIVMPIMDGIEFSQIMGKKYPEIQLIILSSYDKFDYVKNTFINGAVDYMLKPTLNPETLLLTLIRTAGKIPGMKLKGRTAIPYESQLEKVLLGYKEHLDEKVFDTFFIHTRYRLAALDLRKTCGRNRVEMMEAKDILESYYGKQEKYITQTVVLREGILCIVMNFRVKDESTILSDAAKIAEKMHRLYSRTFLVMSRGFSDIQQIKQYYDQDIMAEISHAFYNKDKSLLITEAYQTRTKVRRFAFELFSRYLNQGNYMEALQMFTEYVAYLGAEQVEEDRLKNLTKNLLYNYLMEIEKLYIDSDRLKEKYFEEIDQAHWMVDFEALVERISGEIKERLAKSIGMEDIRVASIKQYIAKHYNETLELSDLAQKFQFSYNYLSSYFSQNTKEGFSEYLNKIRIGHACELLKQGNLTIAEIGGNVGYSDQSYFCRVFKKVTDETPSGYRRRVQQG